jgi:hypothetical protein
MSRLQIQLLGTFQVLQNGVNRLKTREQTLAFWQN